MKEYTITCNIQVTEIISEEEYNEMHKKQIQVEDENGIRTVEVPDEAKYTEMVKKVLDSDDVVVSDIKVFEADI